MKQYVVFLSTLLLVLSQANAAPQPGALPTGGSVAAGSATFSQAPNSLQINQTSQKAIINWQSFNIGANASTHFQQPAGGIALNRISPTQGASQIYGRLSATGQIILVNQAGIFFGPGAVVNVGGIIASTSDITDSNFLSGNYKFDQPSQYQGSIVNKGQIIARDNGLVALIGNSVSNEGLIQARAGNVVLASGNKFTVSLNGDQLINFTVDEATPTAGIDANGNVLKNAVSNSGQVFADGGRVIITAQVARGVVDQAINMSGVVQARSVVEHNGEIILSANGGDVLVSGKLDASGTKGGTVKVLGDNVHLTETAKVIADGLTGGGTILIGGNFQGKGPEKNAKNTTVDRGALLSANAIDSGDGGRIIVWSDGNTLFHGSASATGGSLSGNGGFIETSGKYLDVSNSSINLKAAAGTYGTWLLDPTTLYIANDLASANALATAEGSPLINDTTADEYSTSNPYTFSTIGTASESSLLTIDTLLAALANGNVVVMTDNSNPSATGTGDIKVVDQIIWGNPTSLTLSAYHDVILYNNIGNSNGLARLKLIADNSGTGAGTVCGLGGATVCGGEIMPANGTVGFAFPTAVSVYYNPAVFGTQQAIFSTTTPQRYMLINSLGGQFDTTTASLASLSNNAAFANQSFALSKNIDATLTNTWGAAGFNPIANFTGRFDGQNFTISNLFINNSTSSGVGLFGTVGLNGVVSNVGLINPSITKPTNGGSLGAIAGITSTSSQITNVYSLGGSVDYTGTFLGNVGGLVGLLGGSLSNSYTTTTVNANFLNSPFASAIAVGGLVGTNDTSGTITTSYTVNNVNATTLGGLAPINEGGIAGRNLNTAAQSINNSYSLSNLTFNGAFGGAIGGIVGSNSGGIVNTYARAPINVIGFTGTTGGLIGTNTGAQTASNSFWDPTLSLGTVNAIGGGSLSCPGCGPVTQLTSTYSGAGWNIGLPGSSSTWQMVDNVIYPHLLNEGLYTIGGTVFSDSAGTTPVGSGVTVFLVNNGTTSFSTTTDSNGQYSFLFSTASANPVPNGNLPIGSNVLIFPNSGATGNLVFSINGQSVSSANILNNKIIAGVTNGNATSNTIMNQAALSSSFVFYTAGSNNSTVVFPGFGFINNANYILNGNLNLIDGDFTFQQPLSLVNATTVNLDVNLGSSVTFNADINGTGKNLLISGDTTPMTVTLNNTSNSGNINVVGGSGNNATLNVLVDPTTQNWIITNYNTDSSITGLTGNPTLTFSHVSNLIGSNSITSSNATGNTWNITGINSGTLNTGNVFNFSGFNTLQASDFTDTFNMQPGGQVSFIKGATSNPAGSTLDFSAITGVITADATSVTSSAGVTQIANIGNLIGNDGTSGTNSTLSGTTDFTINSANAGSVDNGLMAFSGFGNLAGGNLFTFTGTGSISGNLTPTSVGESTIDFTGLSGSPTVNVTLIDPGTNHGFQGNAPGFVGGFDDIDVINNTSSPDNTLIGTADALTLWTLSGAGSGSITSIPFTFSGFPNIQGGQRQNILTVTSGADFNVVNAGGAITGGNQFHLQGGNITTLFGGTGPNNILFNEASGPVTIAYTGPNSGFISGAVTVGSFDGIDVVNNFSSNGTTYDIDNSVGVLVAGDNAIVNIGATGNIGTLTGGTGGVYSISGTIGTLGAGSNSTFTLNTGANITSIGAGGGADTNSITLNTASANLLTINGTSGSISGGITLGGYTNIGNLIGSNNGDTFNIAGTLNSITGGSAADTFMLNPTASVTSINGGGGANTLQALSGSPTWNITGTNSGNVAGMVGGFTNMSNLTGSPTGTNTFKFFSASPITGIIDGGNIVNTNLIDVSAVPQTVNLILGPKPGVELNQGVLSTSGGTLASFTQVQSSLGNGGLLTATSQDIINSVVLDPGSLNSGFVSDPFFFTNFFLSLSPGAPAPLVPIIITTTTLTVNPLIPNIITGSSSSLFENQLDSSILLGTNDNLIELINNQIQSDIDLTAKNTYCFQ